MDIGSNTTRLLVADAGRRACRPVGQERVFTRLGSVIARDGVLPLGKVAEVAELAGEQVARARALGARRIAVIGTAALRQAANGAELNAAVTRTCGVGLRILAPGEEARLAFAGATLAVSGGPEPLVVIDVGGGSTEVVAGRVGATGPLVESVCSLPIGSGLLTDRHVVGDPPAASEIGALREASRRAFLAVADGRFSRALAAGGFLRALAAGGSATSLGRVVGRRLDSAGLEEALRSLCAGPAAEVGAALGLHPERVRLLPAGLILLEAAGARLGVPLEVAGGGVREGAVCQLAEQP